MGSPNSFQKGFQNSIVAFELFLFCAVLHTRVYQLFELVLRTLCISIGALKMRNKMIIVTIGCLFLSGCAGMTRNETAGAAIGGVSGALIGGANGGALGAGVGAVAGGLVGGAIGHTLDH